MAAQESDIAQAEVLLADHEPEAVIADKGYDKKGLVEEVERRGAEAVIPTQKGREGAAGGRSAPVPGAEPVRAVLVEDQAVSAGGDAVNEKKAANYLAFVKVAAMMVMLR